MQTKSVLPLFMAFLFTLLLQGQYACPPCNSFCDGLNFDEPGICPHCQMELIPSPPRLNGSEALQRLQTIAADTSMTMAYTSMLADVFGPRLMGTPNYYNAVCYAQAAIAEAGADTTWLQSFDRNYTGWEATGYSLEITAPFYNRLHAHPLAFTSSTEGEKSGKAILLNQLEDIYEIPKDQLKGSFILLRQYYRPNSARSLPGMQRLSDELLMAAAANPDPNDRLIGYHSRRSVIDVFGYRDRIKKQRAAFFEYCHQTQVGAIIEPSDFPYGILHADGNRAVPAFNKGTDLRPVASFVVANEQFGRMLRLIEQGQDITLKGSLSVKTYLQPEYNVNLLAEIKGSDPDKSRELVIAGAHLDSWHAGTGAVDNASNCAVIMEALRLIAQSGIKPDRTIRIVLWGGEEQVFAGSSAYMEERVGNLYTGKPEREYPITSAYLNLDNGAGKIRGLYLMGNEEVRPILARHLAPFEDSQTLTLQYADQTDHILFERLGIPAFQFIQDPLNYISAVHHTNMDVFEYVPEEDLDYNALLVAHLLLQLANDEPMLARKPYHTVQPSREGNTEFNLKGYKDANAVYLVGDFNNWGLHSTPLFKTEEGWSTKIELGPGQYVYKYIVDGWWTSDPSTPEAELVKDGQGHAGLTIKIVK